MTRPDGYTHFTIQQLQPGDEGRLSRFYGSLSERTRFFFEPYTYTDVESMKEVVHRALRGEDLSLVALGPEGEVFAHVFFRDVVKDVPHLGIGLRDEYQNLGLGRPLMAYLISLAKHVLHKKRIGLTVMKENKRAIKLYEGCGFKVIREVAFRGENDSYEMELSLERNSGRLNFEERR